MAKDNVFMGVAAVGGVGLGYALSKLMGGGIPSEIDAVASLLTLWDTGPRAWLDKRGLFGFTESNGAKGGVYAFTFSGPGDSSHLNPQAIVCVKKLESTGEIGFEAAKLAGVAPILVYYDGVLKTTLVSPSVIFTV